MKSWIKRQGLVSSLTCFCLFALAVYGQTGITRSLSLPDSLSSNGEKNAVLPIATEGTGALWQANNSQTGKRPMTAYNAFLFCNYKGCARYSYSAYDYPDWHSVIHLQVCQRACQLVDIPPPSCCLS